MENYFDQKLSAFNLTEGQTDKTVALIAERYINENGCKPYTVRPFNSNGLLRGLNYRYRADFSTIYPQAPELSYVYLRGVYNSGADGSLKMAVLPFGPVKIYSNNAEVFATTFEDERYADKIAYANVPVKAGSNQIVLRFTKTKAGFGAEFGTWLGKLDYYFLNGCSDFCDFEGFDVSGIYEKPLELPVAESVFEQSTAASIAWSNEQLNQGVLRRIFDGKLPEIIKAGTAFAAKTRLKPGSSRDFSLQLTCSEDLEAEYFYNEKDNNSITIICSVKKDINRQDFTGNFECKILDSNGKKIHCINPFLTEKPERFAYAFCGPFDLKKIRKEIKNPESFLYNIYKMPLKDDYWHLDFAGGYLRLYNDNPLFGHWNYPLGVTLYGLVESARKLSEKTEYSELASKIKKLLSQHITSSVTTLPYAMFDKKNFGGATAVHHLMTSLDSLDDCGSFASTILEISRDTEIDPSYKKAVEIAGRHIVNRQSRLPDGTFFRKRMMHNFHNGTMWADDLYMSVPFLIRYSKFKDDKKILDDAAAQFEGFKKLLYMPEERLMAHVFDFKRGMNTSVPWGRGNGWTIFSLSEVLQVLPQNHKDRKFLIEFFNDFARGILANQDENGMWHQVLNMKESYIETSCTAMFICAFSRGLRNGWFTENQEAYKNACKKAWSALTKYSIDSKGNVHGVCRGSEFAFNPRYYQQHLLPRFNDTHGIGIVLLAGVEMEKGFNLGK